MSINKRKNKQCNYPMDFYSTPPNTDIYIMEKSQNHYEKWKCPYTRDYSMFQKRQSIGEEICGPENVGGKMELKGDGKIVRLKTVSGTHVWSARIRGSNMGSGHTAIMKENHYIQQQSKVGTFAI